MPNDYRLCRECPCWRPYSFRGRVPLDGICLARNSITVSLTRPNDCCQLPKDEPLDMKKVRLVYVENDKEEEV